jgi:hypothetical protein
VIEQQRIHREYLSKIRAFKATEVYRIERCNLYLNEAGKTVEYYTALLTAPHRLHRAPEQISGREKTRAEERVAFYQARLDAHAKDGINGLLQLIEKQNDERANALLPITENDSSGDPDAIGQRRRVGGGGSALLFDQTFHALRSEEDGLKWKADQEAKAAIARRWKTAHELSYAEYVKLHEEDWKVNVEPEIARLKGLLSVASSGGQKRDRHLSKGAKIWKSQIDEILSQKEVMNRKKWLQWRQSVVSDE